MDSPGGRSRYAGPAVATIETKLCSSDESRSRDRLQLVQGEEGPQVSAQGRPAPSADKDGSYTARHLLVLEGLDAVRKRPGMYIGSNDGRGLMHCLWEIIDNSVDEALAGYGDQIEIILHKDGSAEVRDTRPRHPRGRGAQDRPVRRRGRDDQAARRRQVRRRLLRRLRRPARRRRLGGERAELPRWTWRWTGTARVHAISFQRGVPGVFDGDGPEAKFKPESGLRKVGRSRGPRAPRRPAPAPGSGRTGRSS